MAMTTDDFIRTQNAYISQLQNANENLKVMLKTAKADKDELTKTREILQKVVSERDSAIAELDAVKKNFAEITKNTETSLKVLRSHNFELSDKVRKLEAALKQAKVEEKKPEEKQKEKEKGKYHCECDFNSNPPKYCELHKSLNELDDTFLRFLDRIINH